MVERNLDVLEKLFEEKIDCWLDLCVSGPGSKREVCSGWAENFQDRKSVKVIF
jgi:hypothetical protein